MSGKVIARVRERQERAAKAREEAFRVEMQLVQAQAEMRLRAEALERLLRGLGVIRRGRTLADELEALRWGRR